MRWLPLLILLLPVIELTVLVKIAVHLGVLSTIALLIVMSMLGGAILKHQGFSTLNRANWRMQAGELPTEEIRDGILIAIGGLLFIIPGFVTDIMGLFCIIPLTRHWLGLWLFSSPYTHSFIYTEHSTTYTQHNDQQRTINVIEGEVIRKDNE